MVPVSICLTTWNRAKALPQTINSLLRQSFEDFELIISDDCSHDGTEQLCREYERRDSRIRYFRNAINLNMPGNLNAAIRRARGQYIANLHDGDIFRFDLIEKWKTALDDCGTAAFAFNDYRVVSHDGKERIYRAPFGPVIPGTEIALYYFRTVTSCVWGTVMARASAYQQLGLFDEHFGFIADVEMWLRLASHFDIAYVSEPLITLGERPGDHPFRHGLWRSAFWAFAIYLKYLEVFRPKLPDACEHYQRLFSRTRRKYFIQTLLYSIRHRQWERFREGIAIWRDADDSILRVFAALFAAFERPPQWYRPDCWQMACIPQSRNS